MFLKEDSSAHQGCIYLIKNTTKNSNIVKYNTTILNSCFLCEYI